MNASTIYQIYQLTWIVFYHSHIMASYPAKVPFRPAWWLPSGHLQTLWPALFRHQHKLRLSIERLELPDGDFVDLCKTEERDAPIVAVFHGLEGSINSAYANGIMKAIDDRGWYGVFMHFRGCGRELNRLARNYHSGDTGDIAFLIQTMRQRHPQRPLFAVGYSLGGNALLKYLGEEGSDPPLDAAVAVSVPFLLADSAKRLERGLSRLYQSYLLARLREKMHRKYRNAVAAVKIDNLKQLNTFYKFDDQITAPLHGFLDVHDYYRKSSSRQYLKNISIPTLIIQAVDDPFMTADTIPGRDELSDSIQLEASEHGGHVGFISGRLPWRAHYWLEKRIPEFFSTILTSKASR